MCMYRFNNVSVVVHFSHHVKCMHIVKTINKISTLINLQNYTNLISHKSCDGNTTHRVDPIIYYAQVYV